MKDYTLGLDIGANSVGWALVPQEVAPTEEKLVLGVRAFEEGTERTNTPKEKSRNVDRRAARGARRLHDRRSRRKTKLAKILTQDKVWSEDPVELIGLRSLDPYYLRKRALSEALEPKHFARALLHLNQRRGFKSNLKSQGDRKKEEGKVDAATKARKNEIEASGAGTLGEFLADELTAGRAARLHPVEKRAICNTSRCMYRKEFEEIWKKQAEFHKEIWTPELKEKIREAIFFQRPLKPQTHLIGKCELEPGEKRCPKASWLGQHFRVLQEINNLRVLRGGEPDLPLNEEQRKALLEKLSSQKEAMEASSIRKLLELGDAALSLEDVHFRTAKRRAKARLRTMFKGTPREKDDQLLETIWETLIEEDEAAFEKKAGEEWGLSEKQAEDILKIEKMRHRKLKPNHIEAGLRRIFKEDFSEKAKSYRRDVWGSLVEMDGDAFKKKTLSDPEWHLSEKQIDDLFKIERPAGYFSLSEKAICKLLPHLAKGMTVDKAIEAAYPKANRQAEGPSGAIKRLPRVNADRIRNPVVSRAMTETRKVVNAILKKYGLPFGIVVELARESKKSIEGRKELFMDNLDREAENKRVRACLTEHQVNPSRDNVIKYRLWEECNCVCPYTGRTINFSDLFGDNRLFDVEHIFPHGRSFDDSFLNKTLCAISENQHKHNQTPYEAYSPAPDLYEAILQRVRRNKKMPYEKRRRFEMTEIPDGFSERQLRDTSHIATEVVDYLKKLGVPVDTTRGPITAELRHQWHLDTIFYPEEPRETRPKKIRNDHRHHAVDAVVIALTTAKHIHNLSLKEDLKREKKQFPSPWEDAGYPVVGFRNFVEAEVEKIIVSHRPRRKISGKILEATFYGPTYREDWYASRVPVERLTFGQLRKIANEGLKTLVLHHILENLGKSATEEDLRQRVQELLVKGASGEQGSGDTDDQEDDLEENAETETSGIEDQEDQNEEEPAEGAAGKKFKKILARALKKPLYMKGRDGKQGPLVRKVRVYKKMTSAIRIEKGLVYKKIPGTKPRQYEEVKQICYAKPGGNHHVSIYEYKDEQGEIRRCKDFVTRFEAYKRVKAYRKARKKGASGEELKRLSPVRRTHSDHPEAKFLMTLTINDMVRLKEADGKTKRLYRVQKMTDLTGEDKVNLTFRLHTAATLKFNEERRIITSLSPEKFQVEKVTVDPLGKRIHPCHD